MAFSRLLQGKSGNSSSKASVWLLFESRCRKDPSNSFEFSQKFDVHHRSSVCRIFNKIKTMLIEFDNAKAIKSHFLLTRLKRQSCRLRWGWQKNFWKTERSPRCLKIWLFKIRLNNVFDVSAEIPFSCCIFFFSSLSTPLFAYFFFCSLFVK